MSTELKATIDMLISAIDTLEQNHAGGGYVDETDVRGLTRAAERAREVLLGKPCNCGRLAFPHTRHIGHPNGT